MDRGLRRPLDEDPVLRRSDLVVEPAQEAQADPAIDIVVAELEHVDRKAPQDDSESDEFSHLEYVALFAPDRRVDAGSTEPVACAVAACCWFAAQISCTGARTHASVRVAIDEQRQLVRLHRPVCYAGLACSRPICSAAGCPKVFDRLETFRDVKREPSVYHGVPCGLASTMTLASLQSISLAAIGERSVEGVLATIVERLVAHSELALARVWLVGPTNTCRVCVARGDKDDATPRLHLAASAGRSSDGTQVWRRLDGEFHRFDIGSRRVGHIATDGAPLLLQRDESTALLTRPEWLAQEGIASFAGHPLTVDDRRIGVIGVFSRRTLDDGDLVHLRQFAEQCAVVVASSRVFAELETENRVLAKHNEYLREEIESTLSPVGILGTSAAIQHALDEARLVAGTASTVLLLGETGTGKELFARHIHAWGTRRERPLVKVNCGSIPHELFESEFFGHVKGSFTGAIKDRLGRFQLAHEGTLFLDEVGEISLDLQPKLLRALQEGDFERVGDDKTIHVDVRVIAATNRDLLAEVRAGKFREDLYYRLAVFPISIPPLRDRVEDIPIIARYLAQRARRAVGRPAFELTDADLNVLGAYAWPGNIRELANVIERAAILSDGRNVDLATILPAAITRPQPPAGVVTESVWRELEKQNLIAALRTARGKLSGPGGAAELLGTKPTTLSSRLRALGIDAKAF